MKQVIFAFLFIFALNIQCSEPEQKINFPDGNEHLKELSRRFNPIWVHRITNLPKKALIDPKNIIATMNAFKATLTDSIEIKAFALISNNQRMQELTVAMEDLMRKTSDRKGRTHTPDFFAIDHLSAEADNLVQNLRSEILSINGVSESSSNSLITQTDYRRDLSF